MRKTVTVLSLTTGLLAASTLYLAWRLYGAPSAAAPEPYAAAPRGGMDPANVSNVGRYDPDRSGPSTAATLGTATGDATAAGAISTPGAAADPEREMIKGFATQWLAKYDDPVQRGTLLEESRLRLRRQYAALQEKLKLDANTYEQLLTVLAEQELVPQERYLRCVADPKCDMKDLQRRSYPGDDRSAEISALLGENEDEFTRYRDTMGDREAVAQLRGRLNESDALRDEQAEKLVAALSDENKRYRDEITQRGGTLNGWGTPMGMLYFSGDSNSVEQRLSDATAYSRRMRDRAATVLTTQQLKVFSQIQEELLAAMRATMRSPG